MKKFWMFALVALVTACAASGSGIADEGPDGPPADDTRSIQIIGDSIFAWNAEEGQNVAAFLAEITGDDVTDHSKSGAQIFVDDEDAAANGLDIPMQYEEGDWDWVIMNGGANDLEEDCGCGECDVTMDDMITPDSSGGRISDLVRGLQDKGIRVIYLGYYQVGIEDTDSAACTDDFDELDARVSALADGLDGVYFQTGIGLLSEGDLDRDGIHPNPVGSEILAMALSEALDAAE